MLFARNRPENPRDEFVHLVVDVASFAGDVVAQQEQMQAASARPIGEKNPGELFSPSRVLQRASERERERERISEWQRHSGEEEFTGFGQPKGTFCAEGRSECSTANVKPAAVPAAAATA